MRNVYVYGDDVIVPKDYALHVQPALEAVGLLVNVNKSFYKGPFRESCGGDYINGVEVSPVRFKMSGAKLPTVDDCRKGLDLEGHPAIVNLERHARELVCAGLTITAEYIYRLIEKELNVSLPVISGPVAILGRYSTDVDAPIRDLAFGQDYVAKAYVPCPVDVIVKEPCPYKHLKTVLDRKADEARCKYTSQQNSLKHALNSRANSGFTNPYGASVDIIDVIDEALDSTTRVLFGHANTRYAVNLAVKKNVPAFCLTGRP